MKLICFLCRKEDDSGNMRKGNFICSSCELYDILERKTDCRSCKGTNCNEWTYDPRTDLLTIKCFQCKNETELNFSSRELIKLITMDFCPKCKTKECKISYTKEELQWKYKCDETCSNCNFQQETQYITIRNSSEIEKSIIYLWKSLGDTDQKN